MHGEYNNKKSFLIGGAIGPAEAIGGLDWNKKMGR